MCSPLQYLFRGRQSPAPRFRSNDKWTMSISRSDLSAYQIKEYLVRYPAVLEEFLSSDTISVDFLENILTKKRSLPQRNVAAAQKEQCSSCVGRYSASGINTLTANIMDCTKDNEICGQIYDICQVVSCKINVDHFNMYVVSSNGAELSRYDSHHSVNVVGPIGLRMTVSAHVAAEKRSLNITDLPQDSRFPKGVALGDETAHHVIAIPIVLDDGSCYAVIEFIRGWDGPKFSDLDFELTIAILSWVNACVQKTKFNKLLKIQDALNNFLLETTKVMFDDLDNIDALVTKIMMFTKDLVSADRCALFLVDKDRNELFADFFDEGEKKEDGTPVFTKKNKIRFPLDKGIAGYVAKTEEIVNIRCAYSDERFNPEIDKKTGYLTKNILCMPISSRHGVIGVVQMINRLDGEYFTADDESAFKLFAVYCALALHYARLYNILAHQQAQYKVAMEVLEFHIATGESDMRKLKEEFHLPDDNIPATFDSYDFFAYDHVDILPHLFVKIVQNTFGDNLFDMEKLCRFTLTVRKNYRPVTYHNWEHGFQVGHAMWQILKTATTVAFSPLDKMALVFGAICHDLDHRGYSNDFIKKTESPLSALYTTSIMECHHYKQTVTILHAEGHDIFSFLNADEHTELLEKIRHNILATDLATYFDNQKFLTNLIEKNEFCMNLADHRNAMYALMMTGADLISVPKPWETQQQNVDALYNEFWKQGDEEKQRGMTPMPMMDRDCKDEVPKQQIGFINFVCKPMYETLSTLLPGTRPLLDGCLRNRDHWEALIAEQVTKQTTLIT